MNQRRKVTLAALFVMTLLLAGVSIFITIRIQQNNAAADANASGFGSTATNFKYGSVFQEFAGTPCTDVLSTERINGLPSDQRPPTITQITKTENNLDVLGALTYIPINCTFTVGEGKTIDYIIHSYDTNSLIDNSREELFARINSNLASVLKTGRVGDTTSYVDMFFGPASDTVSSPNSTGEQFCRANFFHNDNDFEYAEVVYKGFGDCNSILEDNNKLTFFFAGDIVLHMYSVNKQF